MLQKAGAAATMGPPRAVSAARPTAPRPASAKKRTKPTEFVVKEVRSEELRKVAWPTRTETINYSLIVFVALVILMAFVGLMDYVFGDFVLKLFNG